MSNYLETSYQRRARETLVASILARNRLAYAVSLLEWTGHDRSLPLGLRRSSPQQRNVVASYGLRIIEADKATLSHMRSLTFTDMDQTHSTTTRRAN